MKADFPSWLRAAHVLNIVFLGLLARSGIQILAALPKLYWSDHCTPGSEWLNLSGKPLPKGKLWTSMEEERAVPAWLALPGGHHLGVGRHWHFAAVLGWLATGAAYVVLLFATGEWRRLVPTSWSIIPDAFSAFVDYLSFRLPPEGDPYNALQQLAYFGVVFVLAPLALATGAAMSPAVAARFPRAATLFGGKQGARSLHFACLLSFLAFSAVHTAMVSVHGLPRGLALVLLDDERRARTAVVIGMVLLATILLVHVAATVLSLRRPRATTRALGGLVDPIQRLLSHRLVSRQGYRPDELSPTFRVNGRPPEDDRYRRLAAGGFADWRLQVAGLVEHPLELTLEDLGTMRHRRQITKHHCIQGWTAIAEWGGVPLDDVLERAQPLAAARYVILHAMDDKAATGVAAEPRCGRYYESLDLNVARHPQTLLAYEMNGKPLPLEHGAPLRLRAETQLGFKMVKWIAAIELVADPARIAGGSGGWREDHLQYSPAAAI